MKIAIMFRAVEEIDGPGIASRNLIDKLIEIDKKNKYVVLYMNPEFVGRYKQYDNVKEILIKSKRKIIYDQIIVPWICHKEQVDLIFSPKFTLPLFSSKNSIVIQRGSEYWVYPKYYDRLDLLYVNIFLPLYCRKADIVVTLSDVLKEDLHRYLQVPMKKMHTIYSAPHENFRLIEDRDYLEKIRNKFGLPKERFVLAVTKPYAAVGSSKKEFYPGKNTKAVVESFIKCKDQLKENIKLVLLGKDVKETWIANYGEELIKSGYVVFPGYIPQKYMPAIYNLATLLSFPSYYESFGIPLVEAMACGCPVIAANVGACPEIVGASGYLVDPEDINGLATATIDIITDKALAQEFKQKGLIQAKRFSWEKSAKKLHALIEIFNRN